MERRKHERVSEELQATIGREGMRAAKVRDLSEGGACIEVDGPLPVGTETFVGFFLKDNSRPLVAIARVVWSKREGNGHTLGIAFSTETASQRAAIARLGSYLSQRRLELVVSCT